MISVSEAVWGGALISGKDRPDPGCADATCEALAPQLQDMERPVYSHVGACTDVPPEWR